MTSTETHDREAVARRAYELYLSRGGEHGRAEDDWYRAEQELRGKNGGNGSRTGAGAYAQRPATPAMAAAPITNAASTATKAPVAKAPRVKTTTVKK